MEPDSMLEDECLMMKDGYLSSRTSASLKAPLTAFHSFLPKNAAPFPTGSSGRTANLLDFSDSHKAYQKRAHPLQRDGLELNKVIDIAGK
jgi:hypothetical protein